MVNDIGSDVLKAIFEKHRYSDDRKGSYNKKEIENLKAEIADAISSGRCTKEDAAALFNQIDIKDLPRGVTNPWEAEKKATTGNTDKFVPAADASQTLEKVEVVETGSATESADPSSVDTITKIADTELSAGTINILMQLEDETFTRENIIKDIYSKHSNKTDENLQTIIEKIMDSLGEEDCKSKEELNSARKDIAKNLNRQEKKVLDEVFAYYEAKQILEEYKEVVNEYNKLEGKNYTNNYKQLKKELKEDGKWNRSYYEVAYKLFENKGLNSIMQTDQDGKVATSDNTKAKEIRKEVKSEHKGEINGDKDKKYNKTLKGNITPEIQARKNVVMDRREEIKNFDADDVKKAVGQGLSVRIENNVLDEGKTCADISAEIEKYVGADYLINGSKDTENAELYNIQVMLDETFNIEADEKETKKICEDLCGYKIKSKDHTPGIVPILGGAIAGALGGGLGEAATAVDKIVRIPHTTTITVNDLTNILTEVGINGDIIQEINQSISNTETYTVNDVISRLVEGGGWQEILEAAAIGGAVGLAVPFLTTLVFGKDIQYEKACVNLQEYDATKDTYTDPEKFKNHLKGRYKDSPELLAGLVNLVDIYTVNGTFEHAKYWSYLKNLAGAGSNLNCAEIAGMRLDSTQKEVKKNESDPVKVKMRTYKEVTDPVTTTKAEECDIVNTRKSSWYKLAEFYGDCGKDAPTVVRMLKLAQAIKDGNYSEDRMNKLLQASRKSYDGNTKEERKAAMKANFDALGLGDAFDFDTYYAMLTTPIMPDETKLPKNLGVCNSTYNNHNVDVGKIEGSYDGPAPKYASGTVTNTTSGTTKYYYQIDNGEIIEIVATSDDDFNKKVKEIQEKDCPGCEIEQLESMDDFIKEESKD